MLAAEPSLVDAKGMDTCTPLHCAGTVADVVRFLLERGPKRTSSWQPGWAYPHQIASLKGHQPMFDFLYEASDPATRLLVDCVLARRAEAEAIAQQRPDIVPQLPDVDRELVARYCWETNTNCDAVKLMLDLGFPAAHPVDIRDPG